MGRKKLNRTEDEQRKLNNECRMRYYRKHRKQERSRALERYYRKKNMRQVQTETTT